jgi:hypothetical protein
MLPVRRLSKVSAPGSIQPISPPFPNGRFS